jgi:hypothetical protein
MAWGVQIIQNSCGLAQTQWPEFRWHEPFIACQFCMPTKRMYGVSMKVTKRTAKPKGAKVNSDESVIDLEERTRRRAYELYERRGCENGHETEDWLQAEAELAAERSKPAAVAAVKAVRKAPVASTGKAEQVKKSRSATQTKTEGTRDGN